MGPVEKSATTRVRARLRDHRGLVAAVFLVLVVLAVVTAVGGFREQPREGRRLAQGHPVEAGRFTVRIERVELSNTPAYSDFPSPADKAPVFRVWAIVTNNSDASVDVGSFRLLDCVVPGGADPTETATAQTLEWNVEHLDPDVPTEIYVNRSWPAGSGGVPLPAVVTVRILGEHERSAFLANDDDPPVPGPALGSMVVPVADKRVAGKQP